MNLPDDISSPIELKQLSVNNDYYNLVFKKTEKITAAVFYILSYITLSETNKNHYQRLETKAFIVHDAALASLQIYENEVLSGLVPLQHALVDLDSTLTLAVAARLFNRSLAESISNEIDLVLRFIKNHYLNQKEGLGTPLSPLTTLPKGRKTTTTKRRPRPQIPDNDLSSDAILVYSQLHDRATRIKTVLEAKPGATIKDLTDIITDVSAKTIQRDLNTLIEEGEVIRQGERRWSTYTLITK